MVEKVEGIILKSIDYKESSKLVHVFLKGIGITSILIRGAKRKNCKLTSLSDPITIALLEFTKKKGITPLNDGKVINRFINIKSDILTTSYIYNIFELVYMSLENNTPNDVLYDYLSKALLKVEEGFSAILVNLVFKVKLLFYNGLAPSLLFCSVCGKKESFFDFDLDELSGKCKNCSSMKIIIPSEYGELLKQIYYVKVENLDSLDISKENVKYLYEHLTNIYVFKAGIKLKSESVLAQLS